MELIELGEAAEMLGCSKASIRKNLGHKDMPAPTFQGRGILFWDRAAFTAWRDGLPDDRPRKVLPWSQGRGRRRKGA
jgi:predicted DNA-binding transcriptional regulator AlpA